MTGTLRGCPLTGAEQQSADGGLLNMNPPHLTGYRRQLSALFSAAAAESTRPTGQACAATLIRQLAAGSSREADIAAGYVTPYAAAMIVRTLGGSDWPQLKAWSDVAFGLVPSPAAVREVDAVWAELYSYFASSRLGGLAAAVAARLADHTPDQVAHVLATVSNGFGAVPPVLTRVLIELLRRPGTVTACLRAEQSWRAVVRHLIGRRVMFPVALPRLVTSTTRLGAHLVEAGTLVLPSLIGAAQAGAPATIAFGPGPHFCPGAALTWVWVEVAAEAFFRSFPRAKIAGPLDWQPGTLQVPRQVRVRLWLSASQVMAGAAGPGWRDSGRPPVVQVRPGRGEHRPGTCDLPAGAGGWAPGHRRSRPPPRLARPGQIRAASRRPESAPPVITTEAAAETVRRDLRPADRAAWITCRSPPRRRRLSAPGIRMRGY